MAFCVLGAQDSREFTAQNLRQDFLTNLEYGRALYKNPRGIGCINCHGARGEGGFLGALPTKNGEKSMTAPKIRGLNFERFKGALASGKGLMPRYNLADDEVLAIFSFLNSKAQN